MDAEKIITNPDIRRIGERLPLASTPATVEVEGGRIRRRMVLHEALLVNASISGVGFTTDDSVDLLVGAATVLQVGEVSSSIRIRQRSDADDGATYYGAELIDASVAMIEKLDSLAGRADIADKGERWEWDVH